MTSEELEAEIESLERQIAEHVDEESKAELQAIKESFERFLADSQRVQEREAREQEYEALATLHKTKMARYRKIGAIQDAVIVGWLVAFFTCSVVVGSALNAAMLGTLLAVNGWRIWAKRQQHKRMDADDAAREARRAQRE